MNQILHKRLLFEIEKLKKIVKCISLEEIVNLVVSQQQIFIHKIPSNGKSNLNSPLKQGMYLIGIASSQVEPSHPKPLDNKIYEQIIKSLNSIFNNYGFAYFPEKEELKNGLDDKWIKVREIAMPAFLHHYTSGFKVSSDQIKAWIKLYFDGYEDKIKSKFGVNHLELLEAGSFFEEKISDNFQELKKVFDEADSYRLKFLKDLENGRDFHEAVSDIRNNTEVGEAFNKFFSNSNKIYRVQKDYLIEKLGSDVVTSLLDNFSTTRGKTEEIIYITDPNPVIKKPLLTYDGNVFYFLLNNSFYQAIIESIEEHLSSRKSSAKFLRTRDKRLEEQTTQQFRRVFDENAEFFIGAYETNTRHNEHDLIIRSGRKLYIVEAKASPPRVPLRDPDKAFQRIKDHFKSNSGIQKAFTQANSLRAKILNNDEQPLYDHNYKQITILKRTEFDKIYTICITRDDFGVLATNLSLLLEKDDDSPYPWVISITDLEFMLDGFIHLGLGIKEVEAYIDQRTMVHGKVFGTDELEYAGAFLKYGGLDHFIKANADLIPLDVSESNIFDDIYLSEIRGEKYNLEVTEPVSMILDRRKLFQDRSRNKKAAKNKKKEKAMKKLSSTSRKRNKKK